MSGPENFLTRWSRRKRAQSQSAPPTPTVTGNEHASHQPKAGQPTLETANKDASAQAEPAFDLSKLPPIESITAASDIRAFLAPGVPAELTRAALRRAWAADPAIRDFVGLSENSWDFNSPGTIPGFGPLEMTDELRRQIVEMVGRSMTRERREESSAAQVQAVTPTSVETLEKSAAQSPATAMQQRQSASESTAGASSGTHSSRARINKVSERKVADVATQHQDESSAAPSDSARKQLHGGALPK